MTNNAFIYRRPSKWPIATALAAAVLIHLSAVAIAFHQESPATPPTVADSALSEFTSSMIRRFLQIPIFLSRPPEPVPAADFIEPQETGRVIKTKRTPVPIRAS